MNLELFTNIIETIWNSIIKEKLEELNRDQDSEWSFSGPNIIFKGKEIECNISTFKFKPGSSHTEYADVLGRYGKCFGFDKMLCLNLLEKIQQLIENSITKAISDIQQSILKDNKIPEGGEIPLNRVN